MSAQGFKYNVDVALVIDATGSMGELIEGVKDRALKFHEIINAKLAEASKHVDVFRVKVIAYRDFLAGDENPIEESSFFNLPEQSEDFFQFVKRIVADGGGDEPESGLEALALAINSDWTLGGDRRRHIIVLSTDASAHPLEKAAGLLPGTFAGLPQNFDDLADSWIGNQDPNASAKRLILQAPDAYPWTDIGIHWDNAIHVISPAGHGLEVHHVDTIVNTIVNSI